MFIKWWLEKQNTVFVCDGVLCACEKGQSLARSRTWKGLGTFCLGKMQGTEVPSCAVPLRWTPQMRQTQRVEFLRSGVGNGNECSVDTRFLFGEMKMLWEWTVATMAQHCQDMESRWSLHLQWLRRWISCQFYHITESKALIRKAPGLKEMPCSCHLFITIIASKATVIEWCDGLAAVGSFF